MNDAGIGQERSFAKAEACRGRPAVVVDCVKVFNYSSFERGMW